MITYTIDKTLYIIGSATDILPNTKKNYKVCGKIDEIRVYLIESYMSIDEIRKHLVPGANLIIYVDQKYWGCNWLSPTKATPIDGQPEIIFNDIDNNAQIAPYWARYTRTV